MSAERTEIVRRFFDQTELYLARNYNVERRATLVGELLGHLRGAKILDIGGGDGSIVRPLVAAGNRAVFVDLSPAMLQRAEELTPAEMRARIEFRQGDFLRLALDDDFDVVLCLGVLAFVESIDEFMAAIARRLKPGGAAVVQITDNERMTGKLLRSAYRLRNRMTKGRPALNDTRFSRLAAVAGRAGLRVVRTIDHSLILPGFGKLPGRLLARWDRMVTARPWLARHAAERIILFEKTSA